MAAVTTAVVGAGIALKGQRDAKNAAERATRRTQAATEEAQQAIEEAQKQGGAELEAAQIKAAQDLQRATLAGEREVIAANQNAARLLSRAVTEPDGTLKPFAQEAVNAFQQTRRSILENKGFGGAAQQSIAQAAIQGGQIPGQAASPLIMRELQRQGELASSAANPAQQQALTTLANRGLATQTQRAQNQLTGQSNIGSLIEGLAQKRTDLLQGSLAGIGSKLLGAQQSQFEQTLAPQDFTASRAENRALLDLVGDRTNLAGLKTLSDLAGQIFKRET